MNKELLNLLRKLRSMKSSSADDYLNFITWLQAQHTALYAKYQLHFSIPPITGSIQADFDNIQPDDRDLLVLAIDQYYNQHKR